MTIENQEVQSENALTEGESLLQIFWFCYCCYVIYDSYLYKYNYEFYISCGKLEMQTIIVSTIYLCWKYRAKIKSEKWNFLPLKLLYISIIYIPITILIVTIYFKLQDLFYFFVNSNFYLDLSNFLYGLFHPFS